VRSRALKHYKFSVSGYPVSQLIVSGLFSAVTVGIYLACMNSSMSLDPEGVLILSCFLYGMVGVSVFGVLIRPYVSIYEDRSVGELVVRSIWLFGLIQKKSRAAISQIQRIVYWTHGGMTGGRETGASRSDISSSKMDLFAELSDGNKLYLLPKGKGTPGLCKRFGKDVSAHLGIPFITKKRGVETEQ
jgi:hypothetical protein